MEFRHRLREDDAVSPVIGVILMVAITVILAAVIASFVLGLGPDTATTPTATFSTEYDSSDETLTITMESGDTIDATSVELTADTLDGTSNGEDLESTNSQTWNGASGDTEISAGTDITVNVDSDYEVRLVYVDGDTTSTMQTFES